MGNWVGGWDSCPVKTTASATSRSLRLVFLLRMPSRLKARSLVNFSRNTSGQPDLMVGRQGDLQLRGRLLGPGQATAVFLGELEVGSHSGQQLDRLKRLTHVVVRPGGHAFGHLTCAASHGPQRHPPWPTSANRALIVNVRVRR